MMWCALAEGEFMKQKQDDSKQLVTGMVETPTTEDQKASLEPQQSVRGIGNIVGDFFEKAKEVEELLTNVGPNAENASAWLQVAHDRLQALVDELKHVKELWK